MGGLLEQCERRAPEQLAKGSVRGRRVGAEAQGDERPQRQRVADAHRLRGVPEAFGGYLDPLDVEGTGVEVGQPAIERRRR